MSRAQPEQKSGRNGSAPCVLLLVAGVFTLAQPSLLYAQDSGLRGSMADPLRLYGRQPTGTQAAPVDPLPALPGTMTAPAYQPSSPGATPDTTGDPATAEAPEDPLAAFEDAGAAAPIPQRRPGSATRASNSTTAVDEADTTASTADATVDANTASAAAEEKENENGNLRAATVDSELREPLDPGAERTGSIEGRAARRDEEPFAPVGIKFGSFVLKPTLEEGITASSNANSSNSGKPGVLSETTLRFEAASDWERNSALITGYGTYRKSLSGEEIEETKGRIDGTLNIDLDKELRAIAKLGYERAPESASSPVIISGTASQPLRQTFDGSLGLEKDVGKLRFGITGAVEHEDYGDAQLSMGGTLSQKERNFTLYSTRLRGGYEISPAITPFAELELGRRVYDMRADLNGYERSATRVGARAGVELDLGEKLGGEFSAGWLRETLDDDRLDPVAGATLNADLRWSPQRGTTVGLNGTTTVEGTTSAGESGSILYASRLSVEREIRANLTGTAILGADWRDYVGSNGHDLTLSAEAGLTWWINRYVGLTTRARHERLKSNLPDRDATTNSIFVGMKLQR